MPTRTAPDRRDARYPDAPWRRFALAPGIIAALVLAAGSVLVGTDGFEWIRYAAAILALIVGWFAFQARHWWWMPVMLAIAVIWNPVFPFGFDGQFWMGAQWVAALVFVAAGLTIRVRNTEDRNAQRRPR
ncbi:DUF6804 family protein [Schumannella sp. 10F1B-5-1]|uniref:DUF6804 family protein n=1 Tax=Schumannella sp. 10F1B-5-1 TaxID=2590780 RepID=UPI0011327320|nr:DUF6804 family protein [Schumannella sp. 10F1B-5-1]TPW70745.1 hypothetical protein FJ658_11475 [Schumannella sp. 10F1B-5-1]